MNPPQAVHLTSHPGVMSLPPVRTVTVLGVPVARLRRDELPVLLTGYFSSGTRGWISYANIHAVNLAHKDPSLMDFFHRSLLTYCDGQGVRLGVWLLGARIPERITLADCFDDICRLAEAEGWKLYFLGSTKDALERVIHALKEKFPSLMVVGYHDGFFREDETRDVVASINKAAPDVLLVGMGMPKQEIWMRDHFAALNVTIAWVAGGLFEFLAGTKKRCPAWMSKYGLEWLYRLFQEPRRLWKRYIFGNPIFFARILRQRIHALSK